MSQLTRREIRHAQTRQDIINTAFELIITKGADKLSLREIARRVGYKSPAGLYEYFDGKDAIIGAVCQEADDRFASYLKEVDTTLDPRHYLIEIGMAYIRFARENPQQFMFLFDNQSTSVTETELHAIIESESDSAFTIALQAVQRFIDAEHIQLPAGMSLIDLTYCFWALAHGCATLQNRHLLQFPVHFQQTDRKAIEALLTGFGLSDTQ